MDPIKRRTETLISLCICPAWSESPRFQHVWRDIFRSFANINYLRFFISELGLNWSTSVINHHRKYMSNRSHCTPPHAMSQETGAYSPWYITQKRCVLECPSSQFSSQWRDYDKNRYILIRVLELWRASWYESALFAKTMPARRSKS